MAYSVPPPSEKVGDTGGRVPHQIAPKLITSKPVLFLCVKFM